MGWIRLGVIGEGFVGWVVGGGDLWVCLGGVDMVWMVDWEVIIEWD